MKPKYNIGDEVKFFKDSDSQAGKVVSFSYDPIEEEFRYSFTARAYDVIKNDMVDGVKNALESEIVEVGTDPVLDKVVKTKEVIK